MRPTSRGRRNALALPGCAPKSPAPTSAAVGRAARSPQSATRRLSWRARRPIWPAASPNWKPRSAILVAGETGQREAIAATEAEATALAEQLRPLDAALIAARRAEAEASAAMHAANEEALRRESALGARAVETARRRADRDALVRRIATDLEVEDPADLFTEPVPPLPTEERAALEGQVDRLSARLRRLGPPNPDIVAEWESESARWKTLTDGLSDVESASRSLRAVLSELDRTMAERFDATFARVADEFADSFTDLFGGGSARLLLAEGNADGTAGVEIIAQPPGRSCNRSRSSPVASVR